MCTYVWPRIFNPDRRGDVLGEVETLINISKEQVTRAREAAVLAARQDEQENIASMYSKQCDAKVRECSQSIEQNSRKARQDVRLNLSSYGYAFGWYKL